MNWFLAVLILGVPVMLVSLLHAVSARQFRLEVGGRAYSRTPLGRFSDESGFIIHDEELVIRLEDKFQQEMEVRRGFICGPR